MQRTWAFLLVTGLLIVSCGQPPSPVSDIAPSSYTDGLDHTWTATPAEGEQLYAALTQDLHTQAVNIGLSITARNGWGPIELNTSNGETATGDGHPLTLKGKVYATGLGVHADSEIHIHATGLVTPACTRFTADIGIDDEVGVNGQRSSVVFQVYGDGEKLYDSGLVTGATPTKSIDVAIGGKSDLRFVVTKGPDTNAYDHADWASASLSCAPQPAPSVTTNQTSLDIYHLHTGTVRATFHNYPKGTVQLALNSAPSGQVPSPLPGGAVLPVPVVLQTTQVTLAGAASETKDIVISAPQKLKNSRYYPEIQYNPEFFLRVTPADSVGDSRQIALHITEKPINFTARFEPASVSGEDGEMRQVTLTVSSDPPLTTVVPLTLEPGADFGVFTFSPSGPTTGTGAAMSRVFTVAFHRGGLSDDRLPYHMAPTIGVAVGDITNGYFDDFYGSNPRASLDLTLNGSRP